VLYKLNRAIPSQASFWATYWLWPSTNTTWAGIYTLKLTLSSWTVTAINDYTNFISISSSAPTSWNNSTITLVI
jgi:hypothetical protein